MGYYTKYSMEVEDIDNKGCDSYKIVKYMLDKNEESDKFYPFRNQLEELIECANEEYKIIGLYFDESNEVKWYENEDEMKELSKVFYNVLFKLHGEGEETGDIWDKYFFNGKMQYCPAQLICPPFDKNKLQ